MYKETITYPNLEGEEIVEDFYFSLNEAELTELELTTVGGMTNLLKRIIDTKDRSEMIKVFKKLILLSYGEKDPDGKHFNKSPEISRRFTNTEAYSKLFMSLVEDDEKAAAFVNGIMPAKLIEKANEQLNAENANTPRLSIEK